MNCVLCPLVQPCPDPVTVAAAKGKRAKAIAIDFDETALNGNGKVTKELKKQLHYNEQEGIKNVALMGRGVDDVLDIVNALDLDEVYVVCNNGCNGKKFVKNNEGTISAIDLFTLTLDEEIVDAVAKLCEESTSPAGNFIITDNERYAILSDNSEIAAHQEAYVKLYQKNNNNVPITRGGIPNKATVNASVVLHPDKDIRQKIVNDIVELSLTKGKSVHATNLTKEPLVDVTPGDKGTGLLKLADILGMNVQDFVVFGDEANDLSFLALVGFSVAMKNGIEKVKISATKITTYSNRRNGVAKELAYMRKHGLLVTAGSEPPDITVGESFESVAAA